MSASSGPPRQQVWQPIIPPSAVSADQLPQRSHHSLRRQDSAPYVDVDVDLALYGTALPVRHRGTLHQGMAFDGEAEDHWKYMEMMEKERTEAFDTVSCSNSNISLSEIVFVIVNKGLSYNIIQYIVYPYSVDVVFNCISPQR